MIAWFLYLILRFTCSKLSRLFHRRIQIEKYNGKKILTEGKRKDMI